MLTRKTSWNWKKNSYIPNATTQVGTSNNIIILFIHTRAYVRYVRTRSRLWGQRNVPPTRRRFYVGIAWDSTDSYVEETGEIIVFKKNTVAKGESSPKNKYQTRRSIVLRPIKTRLKLNYEFSNHYSRQNYIQWQHLVHMQIIIAHIVYCFWWKFLKLFFPVKYAAVLNRNKPIPAQ